MQYSTIYILIKSENMDFEVSFFGLIRSCSEKYLIIEGDTTSKGLSWYYTGWESYIGSREAKCMPDSIAVDNFANYRREVHEWECSSTEELFSLASFELSIGAIGHLANHDMLYADSFESLDAMSTCLDHTTNLSIFSFSEDDAKCISAHASYFTRLCLDELSPIFSSSKFKVQSSKLWIFNTISSITAIIRVLSFCTLLFALCTCFRSFTHSISDSSTHLFESDILYFTVGRHEIFLLMFKRGMEEPVCQSSVVCEQNKS